MRREILPLLVCPEFKCPLELHVIEEIGEEVVEGFLVGTEGARRYAIHKKIPRFVEHESYVDTFSKQRSYMRSHLDDYRQDRSGHQQFFSTTGFSEDKTREGRILEVGCGYGRFLGVLDDHGAEQVIGVDLSTDSIELAQEFVGDRPNVHLIQCDLFRLPFPKATFDYVFSIGVLHHTPDTRRACRSIAPCLKGNGEIAIWVYPPEMKRTADIWRKFTTKMPHSVLYAWCIVNQALFSWVRALPGGWRFSKVVPGAQPKDGAPFWLRVMSDFDSLSPTFAASHTPEEVRDWFEEMSFVNVKILDRRTSISATKSEDDVDE